MLKQATPPIELDAVWEDVCIFVNFSKWIVFFTIENNIPFSSFHFIATKISWSYLYSILDILRLD